MNRLYCLSGKYLKLLADNQSYMGNLKKTLVIIPAYNEARALPRLIQDIKKHYSSIGIVVINDGSTDHTAEAARKAGAEVIDLPYNLGIGGAMQAGFKWAAESGYEAAAQIDGDGQHDPKYLSALMTPVLSGKYDICVGSRFLSENTGFKSTFFRRIGIRFFSNLLHFLTGVSVTDPTSGFRAYSHKSLKLFSSHYPIDFPEPEAIMMAKMNGLKIGEIPVKMRKRLGGISSIRYLKTFYYMLKVTLAILIDMLKKNPFKN